MPVEGIYLPDTTVVLKNSEEAASATGAAVFGAPARAVACLADKLAVHVNSLKAGEIVLRGSMTPLYPVGAGDRVEAEFDALGSNRCISC